MNVKPMGNRAIISVIEDNPSMYQDKIYLPDTVSGNSNRGKVLSVGNQDGGLGSVLKVDDIVIFAENTGTPLKIENENVLIVDEQDILAIVETPN